MAATEGTAVPVGSQNAVSVRNWRRATPQHDAVCAIVGADALVAAEVAALFDVAAIMMCYLWACKSRCNVGLLLPSCAKICISKVCR